MRKTITLTSSSSSSTIFVIEPISQKKSRLKPILLGCADWRLPIITPISEAPDKSFSGPSFWCNAQLVRRTWIQTEHTRSTELGNTEVEHQQRWKCRKVGTGLPVTDDKRTSSFATRSWPRPSNGKISLQQNHHAKSCRHVSTLVSNHLTISLALSMTCDLRLQRLRNHTAKHKRTYWSPLPPTTPSNSTSFERSPTQLTYFVKESFALSATGKNVGHPNTEERGQSRHRFKEKLNRRFDKHSR